MLRYAYRQLGNKLDDHEGPFIRREKKKKKKKTRENGGENTRRKTAHVTRFSSGSLKSDLDSGCQQEFWPDGLVV